MKLAKIDHVRCGEEKATTYVWVPDEMTLEEFLSKVYKAKEEYLKFLKEWYSKNNPDYMTYPQSPDYDKYPNLAVSEVRQIWEEEKRQYKIWNEKRSKAYRTFSNYLEEQGLTPLWKYTPEFHTPVDWGHNHGSNIDYSETKDTDLPGPLKYSDDF